MSTDNEAASLSRDLSLSTPSGSDHHHYRPQHAEKVFLKKKKNSSPTQDFKGKICYTFNFDLKLNFLVFELLSVALLFSVIKLAGASILAGTAVTMFLLVALHVFPFTPRYIIPVAGMMVGNAMTVTGVTMKRLRDDIRTQMNLVETALALGATPHQATLQQVKRALVISLSPVLDNAKTVGLISLPGAMTGLIMGGASPLEAIQLQIVVMNMLIGASTVSSIMSTYLC